MEFALYTFAGILNIILFLVLVALSFVYGSVLIKSRNPLVIRGMKTAVNAQLPTASIMLLLTFAERLYFAYKIRNSIASSGTGDPRVIMSGVAQYLSPLLVGFICFTVIYVLWGILLLMHARAMERLGLV